jgi:hypothetical protein
LLQEERCGLDFRRRSRNSAAELRSRLPCRTAKKSGLRLLCSAGRLGVYVLPFLNARELSFTRDGAPASSVRCAQAFDAFPEAPLSCSILSIIRC